MIKYNQYVRKSKDPGILMCNICVRKSSSSVYQKAQLVYREILSIDVSERYFVWTIKALSRDLDLFYLLRQTLQRLEKEKKYISQSFSEGYLDLLSSRTSVKIEERRKVYLPEAFQRGILSYMTNVKIGGRRKVYLPKAFSQDV